MDVPRWIDDVISRARFAPYLAATGGEVDAALRMYARNAEIAAAFVYPLHHVEVALRNRLDRMLAEHYGSTTWWTAAPLSPAGRHMIAEAKSGGGTHAGRAAVPGDIVAALNFGFWVSLLGSRYHRTLWVPALWKVFPGAARRDVHREFDEVRLFRNRVMHHEPIRHRHLEADHATLCRLLGGLSSEMLEMMGPGDHVPDILAGRRTDLGNGRG